MKNYHGNCTELKGIDIINMVDSSRQVTRRTFLKYVNKDELSQLESNLGYSHKLRMSSDPYVSYYKGKYKNKLCVYFVYSCIEYIFI